MSRANPRSGLPTMTDVGAFLAQGAECASNIRRCGRFSAIAFPNCHEGRMFGGRRIGQTTGWADHGRTDTGSPWQPLGWSRERLALEAQLEREERSGRARTGAATPVHEQLLRIRRALELAGVVLDERQASSPPAVPVSRMGALGTSTGAGQRCSGAGAQRQRPKRRDRTARGCGRAVLDGRKIAASPLVPLASTPPSRRSACAMQWMPPPVLEISLGPPPRPRSPTRSCSIRVRLEVGRDDAVLAERHEVAAERHRVLEAVRR